jgi:hypothetical protein
MPVNLSINKVPDVIVERLRARAVALRGFLTSCAPSEPYADKTNNYQSIAIVSLLPETIAMRHIGLTIFQNHFAVFPSEIETEAVNTYLTAAISNLNAPMLQIALKNHGQKRRLAAPFRFGTLHSCLRENTEE